VELTEQAKEFERQGLRVAAITYDRREILQHFAKRAGIAYPLLSDEGSKVIRAFGILNEAVAAGSFAHGIPNPGVYVIDSLGRVKSKYFEDRYQERFTAGAILVREFPRVQGKAGLREIVTKHLRLRTWTSDAAVVPGSRISLILEIELPKKMHVYAPGVQGYKPVEWSVTESPAWKTHELQYPPSRSLHLKAIRESAPVYEGRIRLVRDVTLGQQAALAPSLAGGSSLKVAGTFRYQACDDRTCYLPQDVPLEWTIAITPHDRERAPKELQKQ
jgi:hypothetical protein